MSICPSPSTSRGEVVLQPNYFTSSVYVNSLRDDISTLVLRYHEGYSGPEWKEKPFSLFKKIWMSEGWNWMHFKVFDHRTRQAFLAVTLRLFLERTVKTEAPFTRAVALFGLYLFYYTQPRDAVPVLFAEDYVPIPIGKQPILEIDVELINCLEQFLALKMLPASMVSVPAAGLQEHVRYVLSRLLQDGVFYIVPKGGMNPQTLPRELVTSSSGPSVHKGKGRPSKLEKGKRSRAALDALEDWL